LDRDLAAAAAVPGSGREAALADAQAVLATLTATGASLTDAFPVLMETCDRETVLRTFLSTLNAARERLAANPDRDPTAGLEAVWEAAELVARALVDLEQWLLPKGEPLRLGMPADRAQAALAEAGLSPLCATLCVVRARSSRNGKPLVLVEPAEVLEALDREVALALGVLDEGVAISGRTLRGPAGLGGSSDCPLVLGPQDWLLPVRAWGWLRFSPDLTHLVALHGMEVKGGLEVDRLPARLDVGEDLGLNGTGLRTLPEGLRVAGNLALFDVPVVCLPDDLCASGSLRLIRCPDLVRLPEGLTLREKHANWDCYLELHGCKNWDRILPDSLSMPREGKVRTEAHKRGVSPASYRRSHPRG
jgi:hypothetical protein